MAVISWLDVLILSKVNIAANRCIIEHLKPSTLPVQAKIRYRTMNWINSLALKCEMEMETRDCAVQIFDRYIAHLDQEIVLNQPLHINLGAAASFILASELIEIYPINARNFPLLDATAVVECERQILQMLSFKV